MKMNTKLCKGCNKRIHNSPERWLQHSKECEGNPSRPRKDYRKEFEQRNNAAQRRFEQENKLDGEDYTEYLWHSGMYDI